MVISVQDSSIKELRRKAWECLGDEFIKRNPPLLIFQRKAIGLGYNSIVDCFIRGKRVGQMLKEQSSAVAKACPLPIKELVSWMVVLHVIWFGLGQKVLAKYSANPSNHQLEGSVSSYTGCSIPKGL